MVNEWDDSQVDWSDVGVDWNDKSTQSQRARFTDAPSRLLATAPRGVSKGG